MSTPLIGDPASMSAGASAAHRVASLLEEAVLATTGDGAPLPARVDACRSILAGVIAALRQIEPALQEGAVDLAAAMERIRMIESRATDMGLRLRDGTVEPSWGIVDDGDTDEVSAPGGPTDGGGCAERDEVRQRLETQVHAVASTLGQSRARLVRDCRAAEQRVDAALTGVARGPVEPVAPEPVSRQRR